MEDRKETSMIIGNQNVLITHPDKIYFPENGITKYDIVEYYQKISHYILPYLKDRCESMNRFPNGIYGKSFYQKDAPENIPDWIPTYPVLSENTQKTVDYIVCNNPETMAYLNNLGCIELNVWTSRIQTENQPDYLVLDLDPSAKNTYDDVIEVALAIKNVLDEANIKGYPKTSGKTGIHIYIPLYAEYRFEETKDFAHLLMQKVNRKIPELTTMERNLTKRENNKIYLDFLQNRRGQTLASVYSLRPVKGAPVSTPLEWNELKKGIKASDYNIENTLQRLQQKGDIFQNVLFEKTDLKNLFLQ